LVLKSEAADYVFRIWIPGCLQPAPSEPVDAECAAAVGVEAAHGIACRDGRVDFMNLVLSTEGKFLRGKISRIHVLNAKGRFFVDLERQEVAEPLKFILF
jgi:hypothetical protein